MVKKKKINGSYTPSENEKFMNPQQLDYFSNTIDILSSEPGAIHFFGIKDKVTHVGFSTGGTGLLHSQGYDKRESLDPKNDDFNAELLDMYLSSH